MIDGKKVLGLIPARGGSKGIPGKNLVMVAGKPLIGWTIEAAARSSLLDRVVLSSDDGAIIDAATRLGCDVPFVRPTELAQDTTPSIDVVRHAIDALSEGYHYLVLLQPTSPLRRAQDIDACIRLFHRSGADSCVSVAEVDKSPYWLYWGGDDGFLDPILPGGEGISRRQDARPAYALNGAVYVASTSWLRTGTFISGRTAYHVMGKRESVDIDSPADLDVAAALLVTPA